MKICTFGHAGDGNLHPTCAADARNEEEMKRVEEAFQAIFEKKKPSHLAAPLRVNMVWVL
ncbi:hypothetical protein BsIDN1_35380 [Bacillus safensis]|uniref:FAD-binding oxidoreductase/transferase type 4 C-terminal domain-containing protein n=1 Tax=Bacillus safensis TaxID=561879 RepID=A0A5S9M8N5_BACIA|nr:hypothetical protein BsIDN1_35380 [Bacillus safensis]